MKIEIHKRFGKRRSDRIRAAVAQLAKRYNITSVDAHTWHDDSGTV